MRVAVVLVLALTGCGRAPQESAGVTGAPAKSVMQTEAEKACAAMTRYSPGEMQGKPAETQALMRREYDLCVSSVAADDAPGLRGRTTEP
jgi:hypothetical protein